MRTRIIIILLSMFCLNSMAQAQLRFKGKKDTKTEKKSTSTSSSTKKKTTTSSSNLSSAATSLLTKKQTEADEYNVPIKCNPQNATLNIDGVEMGAANGVFRLKSGQHTFKLKADGYDDYLAVLSITSDNTVYFKMREKPTDDELYEKGRALYDKQEYEEAVPYLKQAAEAGCTDAQVLLGDCYLRGEGVPPDSDEALEWYRLAALSGNESALQRLEELGETLY